MAGVKILFQSNKYIFKYIGSKLFLYVNNENGITFITNAILAYDMILNINNSY